MRLSVTRRDGIFLVLALVLVAMYALAAGGGFPLDDAWIHQTYGRNLALNGEWAFIPGQPSAASTSPLYTVLLAIGYLLRLPYMLWTHFLGVLALGISAMLGARLAERVAPQTKWIGWIAGLALLLTWHLIWAAASGMETMLFGMFTLLLIWLAWRELDELPETTSALLQRGAIFGAFTALATLARPEGIMLGGLCALAILLARPQGNLQKVFLWGIGAALAFALVLSPYLLLNLNLTGGLLPNTADAKFEQHAILLERFNFFERYGQLLLAILAGGQFLLLLGVFAYGYGVTTKNSWQKTLFFLLPLAWSLGLIALYAVRLPAAYQHGRYVIPALPALILTGVAGTVWLLQWARNSLLLRTFARVLAISTAALYLLFVVMGLSAYVTDVGIINGEMVASAGYIAENIPEGDLLAIHDIGAVGYFASRPMLDIAGLVSPEVIPIVADADALWQLMQERGARYLLAFPDQIPGDDPTDPRLCPIYTTGEEITLELERENMTLYELAWDATCDD